MVGGWSYWGSLGGTGDGGRREEREKGEKDKERRGTEEGKKEIGNARGKKERRENKRRITLLVSKLVGQRSFKKKELFTSH